jgi:hypothetical protein
LAKSRLGVILKTLRGELTIPEACQELGICESHFHALRSRWLQESLELLEPRPMGRPPRREAPDVDEVAALARRNEQLEKELSVAKVRRDLAEMLPELVSSAEKKNRTEQRQQHSQYQRC